MNKEKIVGIYKITSPTGNVYIGQSVNIYKRWYSYKKLHCKSQPHLYKSLKKYTTEKHKFEILEVCRKSELNERELYYINKYNTLNNGMNYLHSEEQIQAKKLRALKIGLRKQKKSEYASRIREEKKKNLINYMSSLQYQIDLQNMPCLLTGNTGFMLNNPPKIEIYTCANKGDNLPF